MRVSVITVEDCVESWRHVLVTWPTHDHFYGPWDSSSRKSLASLATRWNEKEQRKKWVMIERPVTNRQRQQESSLRMDLICALKNMYYFIVLYSLFLLVRILNQVYINILDMYDFQGWQHLRNFNKLYSEGVVWKAIHHYLPPHIKKNFCLSHSSKFHPWPGRVGITLCYHFLRKCLAKQPISVRSPNQRLVR